MVSPGEMYRDQTVTEMWRIKERMPFFFFSFLLILFLLLLLFCREHVYE